MQLRRSSSLRVGWWTSIAVAAVVWGSGGCGSSGGESNPKLPVVVIDAEELLVDVGGRFYLSGEDSTDPEGGSSSKLKYFWTALNNGLGVTFDDRCEEDLDQICDENSDDICNEPQPQTCATNADCAKGNCDAQAKQCEEFQNRICNSDEDCDTGVCRLNSGTSSPDCAEGICELGLGNQQPVASFVAALPGPYEVRLLVEGRKSNNIGLRTLQTYPSLYLLGSLIAFGGTEGGLLGESSDAGRFAANAVRGVSNPVTGNLLLADPVLGAVREFNYETGRVVDTFGETGVLSAPVAMAFDASRDLYVANQDGTVAIFDGASGLFEITFGDVTSAGEEVTSLLFHPTTGNLLVVDGRAGQGLREYSIASGALVGVFGATAGAATQAVDAVFLPDANGGGLLIADAAGDVKRCNRNGAACGSFGTISGLLAPGGPTAIDVNPSAGFVPASAVVVADRSSAYVVACTVDGAACEVFGATENLASDYLDVFFAPAETPTPDTTTTTSTTLPGD
jgi:hypothetical protein